jgi:hypothetical protein
LYWFSSKSNEEYVTAPDTCLLSCECHARNCLWPCAIALLIHSFFQTWSSRLRVKCKPNLTLCAVGADFAHLIRFLHESITNTCYIIICYRDLCLSGSQANEEQRVQELVRKDHLHFFLGSKQSICAKTAKGEKVPKRIQNLKITTNPNHLRAHREQKSSLFHFTRS